MRSYHFILVFASAVWVVLIVSLGVKPPCKHSDYFSNSWTSLANFGQMCIFYSNVPTLAIRMVANTSADASKSLQGLHAVYAISVCINFIAGTSSLLEYLYQWGGICTDILG